MHQFHNCIPNRVSLGCGECVLYSCIRLCERHSLGQISQAKLFQAQECQQRLRQFPPGDKVLVLLPTSSFKLVTKWLGPFFGHTTGEDVDKEVARNDRRGAHIYYLNLLKMWNEVRPVSLVTSVIQEGELGYKIKTIYLGPL